MRHVFLAATLFGALAVPALAQAQGITVTDAWARPSAAAGIPSAAYVTVTDTGAADRLTGASAPIAGKVELHESLNDNGVMKMRGVPSLPLEPGKPVKMAPGGYHIMLMDLKQPLKAGDSFPLTLTFEKATPVTVQVKVGAPGAAQGMHDMKDMGGMSPGSGGMKH